MTRTRAAPLSVADRLQRDMLECSTALPQTVSAVEESPSPRWPRMAWPVHAETALLAARRFVQLSSVRLQGEERGQLINLGTIPGRAET